MNNVYVMDLYEKEPLAQTVQSAELDVIANLDAKLVRPQTDKMSEKLDDMVGGVGDVRHSGETSAEEDVEDETIVEDARDALRRRPACRPTVEEIRRHQATHLPFRDWCPECTAGSADDWPHHHTGIETEVLSIAELHCDYCFPKDHEGGDNAVVLVDRSRNQVTRGASKGR